MKNVKRIVLLILMCATIGGCGFLENIAGSDPIVELLGLDFSACVEDSDSFDTCFEFLRDNDQAILGQDINEAIIRAILDSLDSNAKPTITAADL